jgi:hypothetical protein
LRWMRRRRAMGMGVAVVLMRVVVGMGVRHTEMLHYNITGVHAGARPQASLLAAPIARALLRFHPFEGERAQGRPGACCTRGLACDLRKTKLHTSIQGSWSIPAFPAQWLYGLLRALPGERLFCLRRPRSLSQA